MDDLTNQELVENNAARTMDEFSRRMYNPKLMALRTQNPFAVIMPFPNETRNLVLVGGVAQDINLPEATKMISFSGSGEYYVTRMGKASIPNGVDQDTGCVMNPEGMFYYVEEIRQLSVIAPDDCKVTVHCFTQL